jgi:hypothetical protein
MVIWWQSLFSRTGNHSRVTGVILGDVLLHLSYQISTNISSLRWSGVREGFVEEFSGNAFEIALMVIYCKKGKHIQAALCSNNTVIRKRTLV